jgi:hypothetical protein
MCPGQCSGRRSPPGQPGVPGRFDTAPIEPLMLFFVPASSPQMRPYQGRLAGRPHAGSLGRIGAVS